MTDLTVEPLAAPNPATTNWVPVGPAYLPAGSSVANIGARVQRAAGWTLVNGVWTAVPFDTVRWDSSGMWSSGSPTRLTCKLAGTYLVHGYFQFQGIGGGANRYTALSVNGSGDSTGTKWWGLGGMGGYSPTGTGSPTTPVAALVQLNVGDYVELVAYHDAASGQSIITGNPYQADLSIALVGGAPGPPGPAGPGTASYGTTLPASPYDGQEAVLVDSVTNPSYQWRFRYNASSTSPYKWEFVGGAPWVSATLPTGANAFQTSSTSFVALTGGPTFTLPRTGDYIIDFLINARAWNVVPAAAYDAEAGPAFSAGTSQTTLIPIGPQNWSGGNGLGSERRTGNSSTVVAIYVRAATATTTGFLGAVLTVLPVRLS